MVINKLTFLVVILFISNCFSQNSEISFDKLDPLSPSKAAFFSAVFPGAGQAFNKKYWKIPIVYAAIGTSIYSYDFNQKKYWNYRNAYKSRKAGYNNDEFQIGLLAQEVQKVFPDLVIEDSNGILSVNYQALIPVLVNALKEIDANYNELEKELAKLESLID